MFTQRYAASTREKSVGATALNLPRRTLFSSSTRRRCGSRASLIISEFHACAYIALLIFCERSSLSLSSFRAGRGRGVEKGEGHFYALYAYSKKESRSMKNFSTIRFELGCKRDHLCHDRVFSSYLIFLVLLLSLSMTMMRIIAINGK